MENLLWLFLLYLSVTDYCNNASMPRGNSQHSQLALSRVKKSNRTEWSLENNNTLASNVTAPLNSSEVDPCKINNITRFRCQEEEDKRQAKWASLIVGLTFVPGIIVC